jgi:hypothetical protein
MSNEGMMADGPIQIVELDCYHANCIIYQAEGRTRDGRHVYVRYRRPWFSIGVGADPDEAAGTDTFVSDEHLDADPSRITLSTLKAWTEGEGIEWPDRITGWDNGGVQGG